jgi:carboxylesterase type B
VLTEKIIEKGDIKIYKNLRYGDKPKGIGLDSTSDRILDVYVKDVNKKSPVLMFIHGGGFGAGDKATKSNEALCLKMAAHGFAVVSINYYLTLKYGKTPRTGGASNKYIRLPGNGFTPDKHKATKNASNDARLALRWVKNNAKQYGLDLSSVAISGGSAGAMPYIPPMPLTKKYCQSKRLLICGDAWKTQTSLKRVLHLYLRITERRTKQSMLPLPMTWNNK